MSLSYKPIYLDTLLKKINLLIRAEALIWPPSGYFEEVQKFFVWILSADYDSTGGTRYQ